MIVLYAPFDVRVRIDKFHVLLLSTHGVVIDVLLMGGGQSPLQLNAGIGLEHGELRVEHFPVLFGDLQQSARLYTLHYQSGPLAGEVGRVVANPPVLNGKLNGAFIAIDVNEISAQAPTHHIELEVDVLLRRDDLSVFRKGYLLEIPGNLLELGAGKWYASVDVFVQGIHHEMCVRKGMNRSKTSYT